MPPHIFLSYRRTDTQTFTERIHDRLSQDFGKEFVFLDVDRNIRPGETFTQVLQDKLNQTEFMLVVIGSTWLESLKERADDPNDFVRMEITAALNRLDQDSIYIIPVLVDGATIPNGTALPDSIRELAVKQAYRVRHNPDFHADMTELVRVIREYYAQLERRKKQQAALLRQTARRESRQKWINRFFGSRYRLLLTVAVLALFVIIPTLLLNSRAQLNALLGVGPTATSRPVTATPGPTLTALPAPNATQANLTVAHNTDWQPYGKTFDGVEMVLVPAGCFEMGVLPNIASDESTTPTPRATPTIPIANRQCFDKPFWIDRTEVSNGQYSRISSQSAVSPASENYPKGASWFIARNHCYARQSRLPTEREWEYAARGPEGYIFPWGNTFVPENVVSANRILGYAPVGNLPSGTSWIGALDMLGNAPEWVNTIYDTRLYPYPYNPDDGREIDTELNLKRVMRGSSNGYRPDTSTNLSRGGMDASEQGIINYYGFRCARDFQDSDLNS